MKRFGRKPIAWILWAVCGCWPAFVSGQSNSPAREHWIAAWATAQEIAPTVSERPHVAPGTKMPDFSAMKRPLYIDKIPATIEDQTVRMIVPISVPGKKIRIELSNAIGKEAVAIEKVHVAFQKSGSSIVDQSERAVTFSGNARLIIRPGTLVVSDPIELSVDAGSMLAVSLYVRKNVDHPTDHMLGLHTSYLSHGDTVAQSSMPEPTLFASYLWLRSVDVVASAGDYGVVCLGDSITDGFGTSLDADNAWPTLLAKRLNARKTGGHVAVLNEGVSGNQLLRDGAGVSALARFDRDVLSLPGGRWVILLEGINDINIHGQVTGQEALTAEDLIEGYRQVIARAHINGIRIAGATLTPEEGVWLAGPVGEATRQKVNAWIRSSKEFDAVIDFDAIVRDPAHPTQIRKEFNPGDSIHPNDLGNQAMADGISLDIFR